jgi:hypothetical protein
LKKKDENSYFWIEFDRKILRVCSKFYLAGSKRARKSGFLRSIDRKNPQFEQALKYAYGPALFLAGGCVADSTFSIIHCHP